MAHLHYKAVGGHLLKDVATGHLRKTVEICEFCDEDGVGTPKVIQLVLSGFAECPCTSTWHAPHAMFYSCQWVTAPNPNGTYTLNQQVGLDPCVWYDSGPASGSWNRWNDQDNCNGAPDWTFTIATYEFDLRKLNNTQWRLTLYYLAPGAIGAYVLDSVTVTGTSNNCVGDSWTQDAGGSPLSACSAFLTTFDGWSGGAVTLQLP